jgi:pimeloyl-ACP methyl ester carboxylesterase
MEDMKRRETAIGMFVVCLVIVPLAAQATDAGVTGRKLIVVDKLAAAGKAKVVFVSKLDAGIEKGAAGDPSLIDGTFEVYYEDAPGSVAGTFVMPAPWLVNKDAVAKYVNKAAPGGAGEVKVAVVKPGKVAKVVGKGLGDITALDLFQGAPGPNGVTAVLTVNNGSDASTHRMCSNFSVGGGSTVIFKEIAGGTGRKLVAKGGQPTPCPVVTSEVVSVPSGAEPGETPGTSGVDANDYPKLVTQFGGTGFSLNNATYTRYYREPDGTQPDAILILVPGFEGGGTTFKILAENTISRALLQDGLRLEIWAFDRRGNQFEDREGVAIARAASDPQIALDWFYGAELGLALHPDLVAGPNRRAIFHDTNADTAFMANWTNLTFSRDIDAVVEVARAAAKNANVFLGGHSAGTGFTARYASTDFDLSGGGPAEPGYAKLRGLVLLEGGGGSTGAPALTEDQLDRIEDKADGGLFFAVRDDAPRCVDGTPCTVATEAADCAGKGNETCTEPAAAYAVVPGLLNPRVFAAVEPGSIQAESDPDTGQAIIQVDQFGAGTSAVDLVPDLSALAVALPQATAQGALGAFLDDDGLVSSFATFVRTSLGATGPVVGGLTTWLDITETIPPAAVPNNGPAPTALPGGVWGQEKEVTSMARLNGVWASPGSNFTDWYYPSAGPSTTSGIGLDSTQLSVGRGRRDIENLTQAANVDIPVIAFGGSNGLTTVPGAFVAFAQSIGTCTADSCDGTPRVVDAVTPNPAFPTLGDVEGGFEAHISEGYAHVDIVSAEDGPDNFVIGPLIDFLARNVQ